MRSGDVGDLEDDGNRNSQRAVRKAAGARHAQATRTLLVELALALVIGALTAAGVYVLLRSRSFDMILGLTLLSYATNLLIFSAGRLVVGKPPVLKPGVETVLANYTDPLPQALVLTAIVIAFAMTAVTIVVAMRSRADNGDDHVDAGGEGMP